MNDQQNPYDPYYPPQPQIVGYDAYGQPVYQQAQQHEAQQHDPRQYEQQQYDPYAQPQQSYGYEQTYDPGYDRSYAQQGYGYEGYATTGYDTAPQQPAPQPLHEPEPQPQAHQAYQAPAQPQAHQPQPQQRPQPQQQYPQTPAAPGATVPGPRRPATGPERGEAERGEAGREYRTEQFSFVEDPDEDSEDVIDWLKFTESRSERREEARRRGRNRVVALVVVLAVALIGGVGYLWAAGKIPGMGDQETGQGATTSGPQKRDVIVLHLHNTRNKETSTALLVNNATTKQGTTVLLPNSLSVANDDGTSTTLAKSVDDDGSTGTREAIGTLLGTEITGTWRLDTPYLENLVELVGGIEVSTDTDVPGAKKGDAPLVTKGENQTLNGRMAVAYATHRGEGEAEARQLERFGQVIRGVLRKMSDDPQSATVTIQTLAQILDPSLPEKDLGASLAKLAEHAKVGDHKTALLPVQEDGTLSEQATNSVVKDILGGSVSAPEQGAAVRVAVRNGSGDEDATEAARVRLINGGYAVIGGTKADTEESSQVIYGDAAQKVTAEEVAKTLGLPAGAVRKGTATANADVTVVLGRDYDAG
ncbi:LytR family transcriptional regulator [Streptomyces sp. WAC05374]|uniref:LytR C-terminal domain-containing protein n=2 Tax=Streptomyces sp. WAC05374 TaxID=2487420 RepID=UPI0010558A66|nr:LytR C-terminal domain-containing protein [Streptomyces sp. WAC05374]TDF45337.1 LytR family transcriptional regulator [Streptomyces sp. WAC05374]TDF55675.1 LytR family transcriptional regulator [Streptomyces sp. WAC05374]TDF58812.1 LytR family transcriptional regulator [Streptomyces sp. WAC05374]